jgi:hypothetical protein
MASSSGQILDSCNRVYPAGMPPSIRDFCILSSRFSHHEWGKILHLKWGNSHRILEPSVET